MLRKSIAASLAIAIVFSVCARSQMRSGGFGRHDKAPFRVRLWKEPFPDANRSVERTILISIDSMNSNYLFDPNLNHNMTVTPNIGELVKYGAVYGNAEAALPSVTQVNHIVMVSGAYPEQIGFAGNEVYAREKSGPVKFEFPWRKPELIKCDTLFQAIKRERPNLKTAVVSGKDFVGCPIKADYNIGPSCVSQSVKTELKDIKEFPEMGTWDAPDEWVMDNAIKIINKVDPAFILVHLGFLDPVQHAFGYGTQQAWAALQSADGQVGRLLNMLQDSGKLATTLVVLVSDHGQSNRWVPVNIEKILKENKIKVEFVVTGPLSHIFLKDKSQAEAAADILLRTHYFDGVWTGAQLDDERLRTPHTGEIVVSVRPPYDASVQKGPLGLTFRDSVYGEHGSKSERFVPIVFFGPGVKRGAFMDGTGGLFKIRFGPGTGAITKARLCDVAPTISALAGLPRPRHIQGNVLPVGTYYLRSVPKLELTTVNTKKHGHSLAVLLFFIISITALFGVWRLKKLDDKPCLLQSFLSVISLVFAATACFFSLFMNIYDKVPGIRGDAYLLSRSPVLWGTPALAQPLSMMFFILIIWFVFGLIFAALAKILAKQQPLPVLAIFPVYFRPLAGAMLFLTAFAFVFDISYKLVRPSLFIVLGLGLLASVERMARNVFPGQTATGARTAAAVITGILMIATVKIFFSLPLGVFLAGQLSLFPMGTH